jgi:peptide deformylase
MKRFAATLFLLIFAFGGFKVSMASGVGKVLDIIKYPNPVLTVKCPVVKKFDSALAEKLDDLKATLAHEKNGAGLAATQVGYDVRAFVTYNETEGELTYSCSDDAPKSNIIGGQLEFVNPVIIEQSGEQDGKEGCLSFPGIVAEVKRPKNVTLEAFDRYGNKFTFKASDFDARLMCHESEHLDGILFTANATKIIKYSPEKAK